MKSSRTSASKRGSVDVDSARQPHFATIKIASHRISAFPSSTSTSLSLQLPKQSQQHRQNAESRNRINKTPKQQTQIQRPPTPPLVLPNLRASNARRKWLQNAHPVRIARPQNPLSRRRSKKVHKSIQFPIPARLFAITENESWREESAFKSFLSGVYWE